MCVWLYAHVRGERVFVWDVQATSLSQLTAVSIIALCVITAAVAVKRRGPATPQGAVGHMPSRDTSIDELQSATGRSDVYHSGGRIASPDPRGRGSESPPSGRIRSPSQLYRDGSSAGTSR